MKVHSRHLEKKEKLRQKKENPTLTLYTMNTKKTESKSLKDTNRIEKVNADLTAFCGLLNESIKAMKERGVIVGAITDETVKELAMLNADGIKDELRKAYEAESGNIAIPFERERFLNSMNEALAAVDDAVNELRETITKSSLKLQLRHQGDPSNLNEERLKYFVLKDGVVSFDRDMVIQDNTYQPQDGAEDFIIRAKALHKQMVDFDREVRLLSAATGNYMYGIGDTENNYHDSLITVGDGIIHLDLRVIKNLDFDHADELLNTDKQFENSKIWGAELYPD